ncbi:MAG: hypothetical protein IPP90_11915 [Gemmatimonadaceae bacterium]|nr:hypothetical protein [Gemmatimonadaceae bacterium]
MTLLEAVIAFVILAVVGIVCLDQSRGAAQLQAASAEWMRAIAQGESTMADATSNAPARPDGASGALPDPRVRVSRHPWRTGVDQVDVTVSLANGAQFVMTRLVPAPTGTR